MRFSHVFDTLGEVLSSIRSTVLPIFSLTLVIELIALFAFDLQSFAELAVQPAIGLDQLFERSSADLPLLLALSLVLVASSAFQLGLWRPVRAMVLEGETMTMREVASAAMYRAVPCFLTVNLVNIAMIFTVIVSILVGATVSVIPQYMTFFVLFPAVYLVAARERAILNALGDSLRWTVSLRWGPWIMGVQALSVVLGAGVSLLSDTITGITGFSNAEALPIVLIGGYTAYKFAQFILFTTVFIAVDADDEELHA